MGHFKVDRSIIDHAVFAHPIALKIWIWCLAKASWKKRSVPLKIGKGEIIVDINPGQFIFGRFKAEESLNIDGSAIYRWIQKFSSKEWELIELEPNNQYTIVTICNWDKYQSVNDEDEQPTNNQRTTVEQPTNTKKKVKKGKEEVIVDTITTWRNDFLIYKKECHAAFSKYRKDKEFLSQLEHFHPNVNIIKSIDKSYEEYWSTEDAWIYKKKQKIDTINWEKTITNALNQSFNKVYYTKQELAAL